MKLGRLLFGLSLWLLLVGTPVLADEVAERLESIVVESFDDPDVRQWTEEGAQLTEDRRWTVVGSKFSARIEDEETGEIEVFPQIAFPETWPTALFDNNPNDLDLRVMGIRSSFDRQGYNRLEIFPSTTDDEGNTVIQPIKLPGVVKQIDLWVWGSLYRYDLEIHIRDYLGVPHVLEVGSLNFQGWRNMRVNVPHIIPQGQAQLPKYAGLELTKLVILTDPTERVDINYVYFDQIKILTDMHDNPFDGRELAREDFLANVEWTSPSEEQF
jgi:hypothetical protein